MNTKVIYEKDFKTRLYEEYENWLFDQHSDEIHCEEDLLRLFNERAYFEDFIYNL